MGIWREVITPKIFWKSHGNSPQKPLLPLVCSLLPWQIFTTKSIWRKVLFYLTHPCHTPSLREVRAGTVYQGPWRKGAYWLTLRVTFSCLFYVAQTHLPGKNTAHSRLGPPTSISNQERVATLTGESGGANSSAEFLSSQVCWVDTRSAVTSSGWMRQSSAFSYKHAPKL